MINYAMKEITEFSENNVGRILIVDDDLDVLDALKDVFAMEEYYTIETASDFFSAAGKLKKFQPDLVLLDIRLGTHSGLDFISLVKRESVYTDCIMMTAHREVDYAVNALRNGAVDYLFKPIRPEILLETVDAFFKKRKLKQEEKHKQQGFKKMALHDGLTGLANRILLDQYMEKILARAERNKQRFSVMFIDLDNFKHVNDSLGHQAGDELLKSISLCLKGCMRDEDIISRIGGDEFVVVLSSESNDKGIDKITKRLMKAISEMVQSGGYGANVSASIGISTFPDDGTDAEALLANADTAMYMAKKQGKNCFQYYS